MPWKAVALLAGCRSGSSSLGTIMAISPKGNRIAAADWDRVLIWAFDCNMLLQDELEYYFPPRDYNVKKRIGQLRPTSLSTAGVGVIFHMLWVTESNLFAITEHGLMQWDLGCLSKGEQHHLSLDSEAQR